MRPSLSLATKKGNGAFFHIAINRLNCSWVPSYSKSPFKKSFFLKLLWGVRQYSALRIRKTRFVKVKLSNISL